MTNHAFIITDMLNDFVCKDAPLYVPGVESIIPNLQREIAKARKEGMPILYVNDSHLLEDEEMKVWPPHAMEGTPGAEIISELAPQDEDLIIEKHFYDGFYKTGLDAALKSLQIKEITIVGVCTEICVHYTASSAIIRGYTVHVLPDCVCGLNEANAKSALDMICHVLQPRR